MRDYLAIINKALQYAFYALFFLTPLILHPKTLELFEFNKLLFVYGTALFILFLWISKMILTGKVIFKRTIFDIPILLFLTSQILSTVFSMDPYVSFWGYYTRFNGGLLSLITYIFLYYAFVSNLDIIRKTNTYQLKNEKDAKSDDSNSFALFQSLSYKAILVSLFSGLAVALWGYTSHFGYDLTCLVFRGSFDVSCWTDAFQPTVRLFSTLGQPNWLAAYFAILIPFALAIGIYKYLEFFKDGNKPAVTRNFIIPLLFILLSVFLFVELLWSQSQSGYLGLLAGLCVFFTGMILFVTHKKSVKKTGLKLIIPCILIFVLSSFFFSNPLANRFSFLSIKGFVKTPVATSAEKATQAAIPALEGGGSDSGKIRLVVWSGAFNLFKQYPIFGSGVETFAYGYYKVKPVEHNLLSEWDFLYNKAHNEYLNYLATTGAVGLFTYLLMTLWFIFIICKYIFKQIKKKTPDELPLFLSLALLASYISILISNFFGFSVVIVNFYFFLIPGFFLSLTWKEKTTYEYESVTVVPPKKTVGLIAAGILCVYSELFLLNIWYADQAYSMGYNLQHAQEYVAANEFLENAVKLSPQEDLYKSELSLNLATLGLLLTQQNQATQGAELVKRSVTLSDEVVLKHPENVVYYKTRIQTFFILSQLQAAYYEKALESIKKARKLAPTDAKVAYNHGLLLGQNGDLSGSIAVLQESINLKPNYRDPRYALAVYLLDLEKKSTEFTEKEKLKMDAKKQLDYILKNLRPNDPQSKELLDTIK